MASVRLVVGDFEVPGAEDLFFLQMHQTDKESNVVVLVILYQRIIDKPIKADLQRIVGMNAQLDPSISEL